MLKFDDVNDVIDWVNDIEYGFVGVVWLKDIDKVMEIVC